MSFIGDYQQELKRQGSRGRCLHFYDGVRCNSIISAHSIQKSKQLSLIAEDGQVYRMNGELSTLKRTNGLPHPKKIGVNKVSTFAGFCKHHDNALFKPIDNSPLEPNNQQAALYAYRSLCREYFVKENAVAVLEKMKGHPELDHDKKSFLKSALIGHTLGFEGLKYHKSHFDEAFQKAEYAEFEFTCFTSQTPCPIQLSGLLYPDYDFSGHTLQNLGDWSAPLDLITFFTAPTADGWAFAFCWHRSSNRTCIPFIKSLASRVADGEKIEDVLLCFSFSCCENHAFRISWWDQLSIDAKRDVLERFIRMSHPSIPVPPYYLVAGCKNIASWNFEHVYTTLRADA
jgi:hypothetical protein